MAIVRELLIRVGLVGDKKSASQVEKSISTFKKRALIAVSAITFAFQRVSNFFSDFATRILDTDEFSRHIGLAIEDLYALQKAASSVARVEERDFRIALGNIQKMFFDLRTGANQELDLIAHYLGFNIDTINDDGTTIFLKILHGLSKVEDAAERSRIAENIFKGTDFAKFATLAGSMEKLAEETKKFSASGNAISGQIERLKAYEKSVRSLKDAWDDFVISASEHLIPVLTGMLQALKDFTPAFEEVFTSLKAIKDFWGSIFDFWGATAQADWEGIKESSRRMSNSLTALDDSLTRVQRQAAENQQGTSQIAISPEGKVLRQGIDYFGAPPINITNEIRVPEGTTTEQAAYMMDEIGRVVQDSIMSAFMQIQHENPLVE